jgi:hypothetical protein
LSDWQSGQYKQPTDDAKGSNPEQQTKEREESDQGSDDERTTTHSSAALSGANN